MTLLIIGGVCFGVIAGVALGIWLLSQAVKYAIGRGLGW